MDGEVTSLDLGDLNVHVFTASEENFLINSLVFELTDGLVVVDSQMFVPDARAFADLIEDLGKPVRQFLLSHNHPDHFLGFEVLCDRFPGVPVAALPGVIDYVRRLGPEVVANRKAELGDLVAGRAIVPDTPLAPGEQTIGGVRFRFEGFADAEAESQVVIHLPDHATTAVFDLACRAEHHCFTVLPQFEHWLEVLNHLRDATGDVRHLLVGHGAPTDTTALDGTIEYATAARDVYADADGPDEYAAALKARFPDRGQAKWIDFSALLLYRVNPRMFTATRDVVLPTTVTGSWPRPRWYGANLRGAQLSEAMTDSAYRELLLDAVAVLISDQERAGLDILTNGDYHLDDEYGGRSWFYYPVERLGGLSDDASETADPRYSGEPGTYFQEMMTTWRYPRVVGRITADRPLEYAKIWRIAQGKTDRPVKFGTISAQTIVSVLANRGGFDEADLVWDLSQVMNAELRELAAAGCKVIQLEDPLPHIVTSVNPDVDPKWIDFLVDAFNHEVDGLDDVELWVHTCWGNPGAQRVQETRTYERSLEIYLERMAGDVWTVEAPDDDIPRLMSLFEPYRESLKKKIALGVVSHRTVQVEAVEEVAAAVRAGVDAIGPEMLVVTTACGFGRQGVPRAVAAHKTSALVQGTNVVRRELGYPEADVRAADPALQIDVHRV